MMIELFKFALVIGLIGTVIALAIGCFSLEGGNAWDKEPPDFP